MRISKHFAAMLLPLAVTACSGGEAPDSGGVSETRMDDIDVIDGTISDDMVDVDGQPNSDPMIEESGSADKESGEKSDGGTDKAATDKTAEASEAATAEE